MTRFQPTKLKALQFIKTKKMPVPKPCFAVTLSLNNNVSKLEKEELKIVSIDSKHITKRKEIFKEKKDENLTYKVEKRFGKKEFINPENYEHNLQQDRKKLDEIEIKIKENKRILIQPEYYSASSNQEFTQSLVNFNINSQNFYIRAEDKNYGSYTINKEFNTFLIIFYKKTLKKDFEKNIFKLIKNNEERISKKIFENIVNQITSIKNPGETEVKDENASEEEKMLLQLLDAVR